MKTNKIIMFLRWGLMTLFVILVSIAAYLHQVLGGGRSPSIHALCPFGGLESLYELFNTGNYIGKIFLGTIILFAITLVLTILFRRSFCGLICPFGAIQEFFAMLGHKPFRRKKVMPPNLDKPLRYLKYIIFFVTIAYAWKTAGLWMAPYDPWSAYAHLPEGIANVWAESSIGLILLLITLLGSLLYDRFFCKYLCPMGAFYGLLGKLSPFKVVRNKNICVNCGICSKYCPMNIDVQHSLKVTSAECINCQLCVLKCPKEGALANMEGNNVLKPLNVIFLVMAIFFGSIFTAQAAGVYNLTPRPLKTGESIPYQDVKGYMSIKEASESTKTELKKFYKTFKIPETVPSTTKMKEISSISPGYEFDSIKATLENK